MGQVLTHIVFAPTKMLSQRAHLELISRVLSRGGYLKNFLLGNSSHRDIIISRSLSHGARQNSPSQGVRLMEI